MRGMVILAMKVLIYNNDNNTMETYYLEEGDPMPYSYASSLSVGEFMGSTKSPTIWTSKSVMDCWNVLRQTWNKPIYVGYAFKRIWEGGHGYQSQHYAGAAMDMGQNLTYQVRNELRDLAENIGCWVYVEPGYMTPTWVHVDRRLLPPACDAGYVQVRRGDVNTNVLVLQDALNTLGYTGGGLDGVFGEGTENALKEFQQAYGLTPDGIAGCATWTALTRAVRGIGATNTTIM